MRGRGTDVRADHDGARRGGNAGGSVDDGTAARRRGIGPAEVTADVG